MERKKASTGALHSVVGTPQPQPPPPPPSSLPDPSFLKDVQAAFKRHRPLGTMSSASLRPRRVPVLQASRVRVGAGAPEVPSALPDDSSLTPPSISGTITSDAVPERNSGADDCGGRIADLKEPGNRGEESQSLPDHRQASVSDVNLLKVGPSGKAAHELHIVQPADPMTQCSTVGSTCATTMSIHSGPTVQSTNAASGMQTGLNPMVLPGLESSGKAVGCGGGGSVARSHEFPGQSLSGNGVVERKDVDVHAIRLQAHVPSVSNLSSVAVEPPAKAEKARKKKYDPDLFFKVNGKLYQRLGKIGSGGSSEVYKVISSDCTIYALKRIKLKGRDYPTACGFCQEIDYLKKLKGKSNIIELVDYEVTDGTVLDEVLKGSLANKDGKIKDDTCIYMVLEYGEIDLAHMLSQKWKESKSVKLDENWLRFYWQQMLEAVNMIHEERIVHSDLKPANFLLVKGSLKLIDFGIAKAIMSDTTNIQRDAQVGTLNYMSPEAFMWNEQDVNGNTIKCGRPSDIWSLGCILYQMVYGKTPFADYKTFWAKFKVITDRNHKIEYEPISNPWLIDLMKKCLAWDRDERWRIPQLLQHPFLNPPMPPLDVTDQP